jgi:hypothetical protein
MRGGTFFAARAGNPGTPNRSCRIGPTFAPGALRFALRPELPRSASGDLVLGGDRKFRTADVGGTVRTDAGSVLQKLSWAASGAENPNEN